MFEQENKGADVQPLYFFMIIMFENHVDSIFV